ncbi:hypothetical protein SNEBB_007359 [Seison nebaliae]|nr:hypothetical protein SNEBB_007359 [Seison nebaliae]
MFVYSTFQRYFRRRARRMKLELVGILILILVIFSITFDYVHSHQSNTENHRNELSQIKNGVEYDENSNKLLRNVPLSILMNQLPNVNMLQDKRFIQDELDENGRRKRITMKTVSSPTKLSRQLTYFLKSFDEIFKKFRNLPNLSFHQHYSDLKKNIQKNSTTKNNWSDSIDEKMWKYLREFYELFDKLESMDLSSIANYLPQNENFHNNILIKFMNLFNEKQFIFNYHLLEKFWKFSNNSDQLIIVIQVHNRVDYLKELLKSLEKCKSIESSLIILSHDYITSNITNLINSINLTWAPIMQIFYPYSSQIFSNAFPGTDPKDCPRTVNKNDKPNCLNIEWPDTYSHYREARFSQLKLHWSWKFSFVALRLNFVNDFIRNKKIYPNILFLEEDHYVAPDMIHVERQLRKQCKSCNMQVLGNYNKNPINPNNVNSYYISSLWIASIHNIGFSLNLRFILQNIFPCIENFCTYDDYNWDWTLQFLSYGKIPKQTTMYRNKTKIIQVTPGRGACFNEMLKPIVLTSARVFHLGECSGFHTTKSRDKKCSKIKMPYLKSIKGTIDGQLHIIGPKLFPQKFTNEIRLGKMLRGKTVVNGGWGDERDRRLCKSFFIDY